MPEEDLEKKEMDEILELTKENNKILRGIQRSQFWSGIFRSLYWAILIGGAIGAFYYIQPYFSSMKELYAQTMEIFKAQESTKEGDQSNLEALRELLNSKI